jgi:hypothetical protein
MGVPLADIRITAARVHAPALLRVRSSVWRQALARELRQVWREALAAMMVLERTGWRFGGY